MQRPIPFLMAMLCITVSLAQERLPVIDMHLHALAADSQGPPPLGICTPLGPSFPAWDPAEPYGTVFLQLLKNPPCDDPVWSPETDEELMRQTIDMLERHNIYGVLSGTPERVATWKEAAPGRFYPGLGFQLNPNSFSPDALREMFMNGNLAVLAEVTNQYLGIAPDDERMQP
jgi:uncharacterized protein